MNPKLTGPQRQALSVYATADERGLPIFGAVDRRLKTMGLIEYVGGHQSHRMHRITKKGQQALTSG